MRVRVVLVHREVIDVPDSETVEGAIKRARHEMHTRLMPSAWHVTKYQVESAVKVPIPQDAA